MVRIFKMSTISNDKSFQFKPSVISKTDKNDRDCILERIYQKFKTTGKLFYCHKLTKTTGIVF